MKEDTLWKWFSLFIRLRDSENGYCQCISCGAIKHYNEMQAGHFVSRRHMSVKYNEMNVNAQCVYCNYYLSGNQAKHGIGIDNKYGKGTADKLLALSKTSKKLSQFEIKEMSDYYRKKVNKILKS